VGKLKFRAWHKLDKKMVNVVGLTYETNGKLDYITIYPGELQQREKYFREPGWHRCLTFKGENVLEIMQFTGFKDGKNQEIYGCDLLNDDNNRIYKVCFEEGCWIAKNVDDNQSYNLYTLQNRGIRVLGNIYENPELLTREEVYK